MNEYYNYAVCNGTYKVINGADTFKEACEIVLHLIDDDINNGVPGDFASESYHIYKMNPKTGERTKKLA